MARSITWNALVFYPTPGSMKFNFENQDGGGDKVGAACRNAASGKLEFEFVPGAVFGAVTNPTLLALETARTKTYSDVDTDAKTCAALSDSAKGLVHNTNVVCNMTKTTLIIDSADGDGAIVCKCTIKGNYTAFQSTPPVRRATSSCETYST